MSYCSSGNVGSLYWCHTKVTTYLLQIMSNLVSHVLHDSTPHYVGPSIGWSVPFLIYFLVADTQLYKSLCPSVRRSVRPSVGPWPRVEKCISAPAHPSATGSRVSGLVEHTTPDQIPWWPSPARLLPTRTRLEYPCIRPCFWLHTTLPIDHTLFLYFRDMDTDFIHAIFIHNDNLLGKANANIHR